MVWDKIKDILERAKNHDSSFEATLEDDRELERLMLLDPTIQEYIAIKYNQCYLIDRAINCPGSMVSLKKLEEYDPYADEHPSHLRVEIGEHRDGIREASSGNLFNDQFGIPHRRFLQRLDELNTAVTSRFWDDSHCDENVFYSIALINFKAHNYEFANKCIEKSIRLEKGLELSRANAHVRIRKRLLKAYCLEYIGLFNDAKINTRVIREAILLLIGYDMESQKPNNETEDQNSKARQKESRDLVQLIARAMQIPDKNGDINEIIDVLTHDDDGSQSSIWGLIAECLEKDYVGEDEYSEALKELAHILAHCLSEYSSSDMNKTNKEHFLFIRVATALMESLGIEYTTCHATLMMEHDDYFSAMHILGNARKRLVDELNVINEYNHGAASKKSLTDKIAEIDFYTWFFSVYARRDADGAKSKEAFKKYCDETKNPIAATYYNIIHMKELLLKNYKTLQSGITEDNLNALSEQYEIFKSLTPHHSMHKEYVREWENLHLSMRILLLCNEMLFGDIETSNSQRARKHFFLRTLLFGLYNTPCQFVEEEKKQSIRTKCESELYHHYEITLSCGEILIFRGDFNEIVERFNQNSIYFSDVTTKINKNTFGTSLDNHVNFFISPTDETFDADVEYLNMVSENRDNRTQHNVIVDLSHLCDENRLRLTDEVDIDSEHRIFYIQHPKVAVEMLAMLTMLEHHVKQACTRLKSYVIFPVSNTNILGQYLLSSLGPLTESNLSDANSGFVAKRFNLGLTSTEPKVKSKALSLDSLKTNTHDFSDDIKYAFHFVEGASGKLTCYTFDFNYANDGTDRKYLYSSATVLESHNNSNHRHELLIALNKVYSVFKESTARTHPKLCNRESCSTIFTPAMVLSGEANSYNILCEYLYSYTGILLDKDTFLLIKTEYIENKKTFTMMTMERPLDTNLQIKLCHLLSDVSHVILDAERLGTSDVLPTLKELSEYESEIKPCPNNAKYIFVSYRSKNKTTELCEPVFRDVIELQRRYNNSPATLIDVRNFDENFSQNIDTYIGSERCIGALLYVSFDYLCPLKKNASGNFEFTDYQEDMCLREARLLLERKKKSESEGKHFFIFPIFIQTEPRIVGNTSYHPKSFDALIQIAMNLYCQSLNQRAFVYKELFDVDDKGIPRGNNIHLKWSSDQRHLKNNNLINCISKNGFDSTEE